MWGSRPSLPLDGGRSPGGGRCDVAITGLTGNRHMQQYYLCLRQTINFQHSGAATMCWGSARITMFNPHHHPRQVHPLQVRTPPRSRVFKLLFQGHRASKRKRRFLWLKRMFTWARACRMGVPVSQHTSSSFTQHCLRSVYSYKKGVGSFSHPPSALQGRLALCR